MKRPGPQSSIQFSSGELVRALKPSFKLFLSRHVVFMRGASLFLIVLALARPQSAIKETVVETEGVDIVLVADVSTSMLAEDFEINGVRKNRLEVAKKVMGEFIERREHDRMGMVAFAARAYTVSPLTLDHDWLLQNLDRVEIGIIEDSTAIGSGITSALNRLKNSKAKSKVAIILTDGINNAGRISPLTAAEAATTLHVKIYTIGAGTKGFAPYPMKDVFGNTVYQQVQIPIDDDALKRVAEKTGGRYFRATDTEELRAIYGEIDSLEKTKIEEKGYTEYKELFLIFLIPGLIILLLEIALRNTMLRTLP
jgi:Ca-activated chloride channel family protein